MCLRTRHEHAHLPTSHPPTFPARLNTTVPRYGHPEVRGRAFTEDRARDSLENLLFGLCRFYELTGRYPDFVVVRCWVACALPAFSCTWSLLEMELGALSNLSPLSH